MKDAGLCWIILSHRVREEAELYFLAAFVKEFADLLLTTACYCNASRTCELQNTCFVGIAYAMENLKNLICGALCNDYAEGFVYFCNACVGMAYDT